MTRLVLTAVLALSLAGWGHVTQAQSGGVALAAFGESDGINGWFGPFRLSPTGVDLRFNVLCYGPSRARVVAEAVASIPDGSTLSDVRSLSTTAVVNLCASYGVAVDRTRVLLPALQFGQ